MWQRRVLVALVLIACGPTPDAEGTGTGTGSTADAAGTSATDSPTTAGAYVPVVCPVADGSVDPFPDPATCEEHRAIEPTAEVEIGLVNLRSEAVFVHATAPGAKGRVELSGEPGGRSVHAEYYCDQDTPTCATLLDGDGGGCKLIGREYATIRLEPGDRRRLLWQPRVVFSVDLPAECQAVPVGDQACTTIRPIPPGAYMLQIRYSTECTGECTCEPEPEGGCDLDGMRDFPAEKLTAQATYDGLCDVVDIAIE